jgi:hypothetical protein
MNNEQLKAGFNESITNARNAGVDSKTIAEMEICREYFTNPKFKKDLESYVWQINQAKAGK